MRAGRRMSEKVCVKSWWRCQAPRHEADHRQLDHRLGTGNPVLIVLAQPATLAQPGKRALHDPALGEHLEPFGSGVLGHDLQRPSLLRHPPRQLPGIAAVGPQALQAGHLTDQRRQHQPGAIAALKSRAVINGVLAQVAQAGRLRIDIDQATLVVEAAFVGVTLQAIRGGYDPAVSRHLRDTVLGSVVTGTAKGSVNSSLTSAANQLAALLSDQATHAGPLKPVELALFREWLRLLTTVNPDNSGR